MTEWVLMIVIMTGLGTTMGSTSKTIPMQNKNACFKMLKDEPSAIFTNAYTYSESRVCINTITGEEVHKNENGMD